MTIELWHTHLSYNASVIFKPSPSSGHAQDYERKRYGYEKMVVTIQVFQSRIHTELNNSLQAKAKKGLRKIPLSSASLKLKKYVIAGHKIF